MKIAFVGKGGSGKSTVTGLFLKFLTEQKKHWLCIDADINMHMSGLLGVALSREKALSLESNERGVKAYIRGNNTRISSPGHIVKTTPPTRESNFLYITPTHELIRSYATSVGEYGHLMHVGTYEEEGIGESCYHTNLAVFEALISHTITDEQHVCVADMTAGTDAFAGSLHASFDLVCLVVEPTAESVSLAREYLSLAESGKVLKYICIIGNKIEDDEDVAYIEAELGHRVLCTIPLLKKLKTFRREGKNVFELDLDESILFSEIIKKAAQNMVSINERLKLLFDLHRKHSQADYIINRHGDLSVQIDESFSYTDLSYER